MLFSTDLWSIAGKMTAIKQPWYFSRFILIFTAVRNLLLVPCLEGRYRLPSTRLPGLEGAAGLLWFTVSRAQAAPWWCWFAAARSLLCQRREGLWAGWQGRGRELLHPLPSTNLSSWWIQVWSGAVCFFLWVLRCAQGLGIRKVQCWGGRGNEQTPLVTLRWHSGGSSVTSEVLSQGSGSDGVALNLPSALQDLRCDGISSIRACLALFWSTLGR